MVPSLRVAAAIAMLLVPPCLPTPARADNQMGYRLLSAQEAATLPRNGGTLGLDIERMQQINESGLTFDIIRVTQVRSGSPGARAGFHRGDQIIAVDGRVFPSLVAFAAYIGSMPPNTRVMVDTIPAGGGPAQAQRIAVVIGSGSRLVSAANLPEHPASGLSGGMSTGTKVAIGAAAAALFGCYKIGCFSHGQNTPQAAGF